MEIINNEFGEIIDNMELNIITQKIMQLSVREIDKLFSKCGWKDHEKNQNLSLPDWKLEKIKSDKEFAKNTLINLFQETPKKDFLVNFDFREVIGK